MLHLFKEIVYFGTPIITLVALAWSIFLFFYFKSLKAKDPKQPKPIKEKPKAIKKLKDRNAFRVLVYDANKRVIKDVICDTKCKAKKEVKKVLKDLATAESYEIVKIKIKK